MILSSNRLKGKRIHTQDGKKVEDVDGILFDPEQKVVAALLVRKDSVFNSPQVLLLKEIKKVGNDAIVIERKEYVRKAADVSAQMEKIAKDAHMTLSDHTLVGDDDTKYGTISDTFFDSATGRIVGFEYSSSREKKKMTMKIREVLELRSDAIVVRPVMVKDKPQKKQINKSETVQVENTTQQAGNNDLTEEERKQIEDTVGKFVTKNILLPTDEVLMKQNEIVTHESLRVAYTYGLLDQVLQNASRKPVE